MRHRYNIGLTVVSLLGSMILTACYLGDQNDYAYKKGPKPGTQIRCINDFEATRVEVCADYRNPDGSINCHDETGRRNVGQFGCAIECVDGYESVGTVDFKSGTVKSDLEQNGCFKGSELAQKRSAIEAQMAAADSRRAESMANSKAAEASLAAARAESFRSSGQASENCYEPQISLDGTKVAFLSSTTSLVPNSSLGYVHLYVKDLISGKINEASVDLQGISLKASVKKMRFSENGRSIEYWTESEAVYGEHWHYFREPPRLYPRRQTDLNTFKAIDTNADKTDAVAFKSIGPTPLRAISSDGSLVAYMEDSRIVIMNRIGKTLLNEEHYPGQTKLDLSDPQLAFVADDEIQFVCYDTLTYSNRFCRAKPGIADFMRVGKFDLLAHDLPGGAWDRPVWGPKTNILLYQCAEPAKGVEDLRHICIQQPSPGGCSSNEIRSAECGLGKILVRNAQSMVLSAGEKLIAFVSDSKDLVKGDTNDRADIFVMRLDSGKVQRISVSQTLANEPATKPIRR